METKKISKWDAAPKSIKNTYEYVNALYDPLPDERNPIIDALSKVLDDYNKLEAKHQLDCGLISDYAEENARLKQKNEKASNNIRDLRRVLEENDIATYLNPVTVSWGVANVALQKKTEHFNTQLDNLRERLKEAEKSKEKWIARYHNMSDICSRDEDDSEMLQAILRKDGYTIEYDGDIDDETIRCQDSLNICKETTQDEVTYQYGRWTLKRPWNFSEAKANADAAILRGQIISRDRTISELRANNNRFNESNNDLRRRLLDLRCQLNDNGISSYWSSSSDTNILDFNAYDKNVQSRIDRQEIEDKDKLIEELRQKIEDLEIKTSYYVAHITSLKEKNEGLGKYVGERVADSIREGCNKGVYKLHPLTRIDIHVEEIHDMPIAFARHAIPRISVIFNNAQTEMERDTAEHECEELVKENEDLRSALKMCERDANMSRSLCHNIAFNAERARNKTPWFNDMQGDDI